VQKTSSAPLEISIRAESSTTSSIGFKSTLDRAKTQVYAFTKITANNGEEIFWNIPRGSEAFVNYLKREMKLEAQATNQAGLLGKIATFSLRGSSAIISEIGKKCASGQSVPTAADLAFERAFLPQAVASVDLARLTPVRADALKKQLEIARIAFLDSSSTQAEIERLNARFLREINELSSLRRNLDRLTQKEVQRLETERSNAQAAIQIAAQEIQNLKPQIAALETQLVNANSDYEAAYNLIAPHLPAYNRLVSVVQTHELNESDANERLSTSEADLRQAQIDLQNLEAEGRNLRHNYSAAQSEEQVARNQYQKDAQELRRFDRHGELRDRMSRNGRIDALEREVQQFDARIRAQQQALSQQEAERNQLNQELLACRQQAGRDCSAEQQRLTDSQIRFQELRRGIEQLESNREGTLREIEMVRGNIEAEVDRLEDDLQRREADSRQRLNSAQMRLREIESRLNSIERVEIPGRQNDILRLDSERLRASLDLADSQRRLRVARQDLASFRQTTGFDSLQADVDRKLAKLNSLKNDAAKIDRDIKRRERVISDNQVALAQIAKEMERILEQIKLKEARSAEVQQALEPYEQEKSILDAKKAATDRAFANAQQEFVANL
jgi:chromosome segregation ATPase